MSWLAFSSSFDTFKFHPLEVVSHGSGTQLLVGESFNEFTEDEGYYSL